MGGEAFGATNFSYQHIVVTINAVGENGYKCEKQGYMHARHQGVLLWYLLYMSPSLMNSIP
jgi:hypothetical protein